MVARPSIAASTTSAAPSALSSPRRELRGSPHPHLLRQSTHRPGIVCQTEPTPPRTPLRSATPRWGSKTIGIDLNVRKRTGWVTGSIGGYYTRYSNFIGLFPTGTFDIPSGFEIFNYQASMPPSSAVN